MYIYIYVCIYIYIYVQENNQIMVMSSVTLNFKLYTLLSEGKERKVDNRS